MQGRLTKDFHFCPVPSPLLSQSPYIAWAAGNSGKLIVLCKVIECQHCILWSIVGHHSLGVFNGGHIRTSGE